MARILGRHPALFMGGENHFFEDIFSRRRELGDPGKSAYARERILGRLLSIYARYNQQSDQTRVAELFAPGTDAHDRLVECQSYKGFLSTFMDFQAEAKGCRRWGNNTPKDIFHFRELLDFYPHAIFVVCVRDVRDFLVSYGLRWTVTNDDHRERLHRLYHPILTALLWRSTMSQLERLRTSLPRPQLAVIHYESLVTEPEKTIERLCSIVGLSYTPSLLEVDTANSSLGHGARGIFTQSVGSWRERLPPADAWLAERIAGWNLQRQGYTQEAKWPGLAAVVRSVAAFPIAALRALHANRYHRGPLLQYVFRRFASLAPGRRHVPRQPDEGKEAR